MKILSLWSMPVLSTVVTAAVFFTILMLPATGWAVGLWQVYLQAQDYDPAFKAARASWQAEQAGLAAQQGVFWPQLYVEAAIARKKSTSANSPSLVTDVHLYEAEVTQKLFDLSQFALHGQLSYQVKQQAALYAAAAQDLMVRTADAYFAVLTAASNQCYLQAEQHALIHQLHQVRQRYKVGLEAKTAVDEVKARYDKVIADNIAARNLLINRLQQLKTITGMDYSELLGLKERRIPLQTLTHKRIVYWLQRARQNNNQLQAKHYSMLAAKKAIARQKAGFFPVISLQGDYTDNRDSSFLTQKDLQASIVADWAIFNGGSTLAATKQAHYYYQQAYYRWRASLRQVEADVYEAYLGIRLGAKLLVADRQALHSQHASLKSTKEGYRVGTRTMVNLLDEQSSLYQAQQRLSEDRYHYLLSILRLKRVAGRLKSNDLKAMNQLLSQKVSITVDYDQL